MKHLDLSYPLTTFAKTNAENHRKVFDAYLKLIAVLSFILFWSFTHTNAQTITFSYTGSAQSWTVPSGVTSITVDVIGAMGGNGGTSSAIQRGGYGGRTQCSLVVSPGQVLQIYVGGGGVNGSGHCCSSLAGGYNGGGASGNSDCGGGGGASDIRIGGSALSNRVVVAGGGGGGAQHTSDDHGGNGGGLTAENGYLSSTNSSPSCGGGGSQTAGGAAGTTSGHPGAAGTSGNGGNGYSAYNSGGGGGGYYGGGGGSWAGGGGGSSYTDPAVASGAIYTRGYSGDYNGSVAINVNSLAFISGPLYTCQGTTTTFGDATTGGTWSSSNTAVAAIGSTSGMLSSVAPGTATLTYTMGGSYTTLVDTVVSLPALLTIAGPSVVGTSSTIRLVAGFAYTWTSSNTSVATVSSSYPGDITGLSPGTAVISYTNTNRCGSTTSTKVITDAGYPCTPIINTFAGSLHLAAGHTGDGGPATAATFNQPIQSAIDAAGNIYVADQINYCIRKVSPSGIITTVAGSGAGGFSGDGGPATAAGFAAAGVAVDGGGNIYINDAYRIRKVNTSGIISTIAGNGFGGATGDGGPATAAAVNPTSLVADAAGNVYFSQFYDNVVRKINTSGIITRIAGNGTAGFGGDGGPGTAAQISYPEGIAIDGAGNLYIADNGNYRVRKVNTSGGISTIAGTGSMGPSGDGGPATAAQLLGPSFLSTDGTGNIYLADHGISVINSSGIITTPFALSGSGCMGDGGPATAATFGGDNMLLDATGNLYITDHSCNVVHIINFCGLAAITGTTALCAGATTTLSDATTGGSWSSGDPAIATVNSTGTVTGVSAGTATIVYSLGGFFVSANVTVSGPMPISGTPSECVGATTTLSNTVTGGTWSSSSTAVATTGSGSGVISGVTAGTTTITYAVGGCYVTVAFTVNATPSSISGGSALCSGTTLSLSAGTGGGTWSSSNPSAATIGSAGIVTGVAAGTTTISYTLLCGTSTLTVTVSPTPSGITGTTITCAGATTTLADITTGGTWGSSNTGVATVNSTGIVGGVSAGTTIITYSLSTGCFAITTVTVNPAPCPFSGPSSVCTGSTATIIGCPTGGTWSSSVPGVATINTSTGVLSGVATGTLNITYTLATGCIATRTESVITTPAPITGIPTVCVGSTTTLSDAAAGGTWSSSNIAVATVGAATGIVTGVASGTTTITYSVGTSCYATKNVTVNAAPSVITGSSTVCEGLASTLSDTTPAGTWSSSNTSVATITSGALSGVLSGTAIISYALSSGCAAVITVTVLPSPAPITGSGPVCTGSTIALADITTGGTWTSGTTSVATVNSTGMVTGVLAGSAYIFYSTGVCYAIKSVTVNTSPSAITGTTSVCAGSTTTLGDATTGGTWSSSNTSVATVVSTTGVVSGVASGTSTLTYMLGTGCLSTTVATINPLPSAITGTLTVCAGSTITLSDATTGGTWSSSNTAVATVVSTTGVVTGVASGTATITYTLGTGCIATTIVTVNLLPSAITGTLTVCAGSNTTLSDATTGGTWSSSNTAVATVVTTTGVVTSVASGTATITYTLGTGCIATTIVTVNLLPSAITGTLNVCAGSTTTLSDGTTGGTWSSSNTAVATVVSTTGVVTGVASGTARITYTLGTGCIVTTTVTVNPLPSAITGTLTVCAGSTTALSDATTGGTWSSSSTSIATAVSTTGVITGVAGGTATIVYIAGGCTASATVTVNPVPVVFTVTGGGSYCAGGAGVHVGLSGSTSGISYQLYIGSATSGSPLTGGGSSLDFGLIAAAGTYTVAATNSSTSCTGGMASSAVIVVNPLPSAITGTMSVCAGSTTTLSDATTGGTWSSGSTGVATISSTGVVTGAASGTTSITYILPTGCYVTTVVTVNPLPVSITGTTSVCAGSTTTLSDATSGGTWSSSSTGIATINSTGIVSGVANGTSAITYTLSTGCYISTIITVDPLPASITGTTSVCAGLTTTLGDATTGGTWSSSSTGTATVSSAGVVTGASAGAANISYALSSGCFVTAIVTVDALPAITASSSHACGSTYTLTAGGGISYSWSPSTGLSCASCATTDIDPATTTSYTVTGTDAAGCTNTADISVDGNRISGFISYSGSSSDTLKVWLIQFNPSDSSLTALDSAYTCMVSGTPYYEFMDKPSGNYMAKAKLLGGIPGTSGYIPTYSLSTPNWYSAAAVAHTSSWDSLHINMIYGTVPAGPGFIGGYISSGAGRGTTGDVPVQGMLVYLMNVSSRVLTYTYTDGAGNYAFSSLADGDYIIYPEFFAFNTIHSDVITINSTSEAINNVDFRQYNDSRFIKPVTPNSIEPVTYNSALMLYPNPTSGMLTVQWKNQTAGNADVVITDVVGREVYRSAMNINTASGQAQMNLSTLQSGIYMITIQSDHIHYNSKLIIEKQ